MIVRRDIFEAIQPKEHEIIQLCPHGIKGYLSNGLYNREPHIIADSILSKIISQKGNVYKVINHGETKQSYLIKNGEIYSHGATIKEARESLIYKIGDIDKSEYKELTLESILTHNEVIQMYRIITGACESGVRSFVESNKSNIKKKYTIKDILELTKGSYGHETLNKFLKGDK